MRQNSRELAGRLGNSMSYSAYTYYNLTIIISYSLLSMPNDLPIKRGMYQAASKPTDKSGSNVNIRLHLNCRGIALKTAHTKTRLLYRI